MIAMGGGGCIIFLFGGFCLRWCSSFVGFVLLWSSCDLHKFMPTSFDQ